jgi:hypothetical protein
VRRSFEELSCCGTVDGRAAIRQRSNLEGAVRDRDWHSIENTEGQPNESSSTTF